LVSQTAPSATFRDKQTGDIPPVEVRVRTWTGLRAIVPTAEGATDERCTEVATIAHAISDVLRQARSSERFVDTVASP
jgi:hypothetical protein